MKPRMMLVALVALVCTVAVAIVGTTGARSGERGEPGSYEVWLIDQEDRLGTGVGTLHIFDGDELTDNARSAVAEKIDLGSKVGGFCEKRTGTTPLRPHMLVFNGGDDDRPSGNTHAVIAYLATGHVVFLDAEKRKPLECIDVGTQAHAAWPTPDQRHLIVANQNGKKLQRIATDYANESFRLEDGAEIDLAACRTPSGEYCQDPKLRPDNAPVCPRVTRDGAFTFVTLRGGGMFVVDHNQTPMRIVAEYDRSVVDDNGCGQMEAGGRMYVNSGAGLTVPSVPGDEPFGHDVYSFELDQFRQHAEHDPEPAARAPRVQPRRAGRNGRRARCRAHQVRLPVVGRPDRERRDRCRPASEQGCLQLRARGRAERRSCSRPLRHLARRRLHVRLAARAEPVDGSRGVRIHPGCGSHPGQVPRATRAVDRGGAGREHEQRHTGPARDPGARTALKKH